MNLLKKIFLSIMLEPNSKKEINKKIKLSFLK
jgi:hypothetical protein